MKTFVKLSIALGCLGFSIIGFGATRTYAATTTTWKEVIREVGPNGGIITKTITHTKTINSLDDIKDSLVATSNSDEQSLFSSIQGYRNSQNKKVVLKYSSKLADVARNYAKYLSDNNYFSHDDKLGNDGMVRLEKAGFRLSHRGELLVESTNPTEALSTLKGSKLHNEIILKEDYSIMGIGYHKGKRVVMLYADKDGKFADKKQVTKLPRKIRKKRIVKKLTTAPRVDVSLR